MTLDKGVSVETNAASCIRHCKGENITAYIAALRTLAEHCNFGVTLLTMLRDCLVCGANHEGIQCCLLSEKDLAYKKAHEIAITLEAAAKGSKDISITTTQPLEPIMNYTKGIKPRSGRTTHLQAVKPADGPQSLLWLWRSPFSIPVLVSYSRVSPMSQDGTHCKGV